MAESMISSALQKLADPIIREAKFISEDQVQWATRELEILQSFLRSTRSMERERIECLVDEITRVAYQIDNFIDVVMHMTERRNMRTGIIGSISRYTGIPSTSDLVTLHKVNSEIQKIKTVLWEISQRKDYLGVRNLGEDEELDINVNLQEQRAHFDAETDIVGREDDKRNLIGCLLDEENESRRVVSIVGMGGLGKTTLAKEVYVNPAVRQHFETSAWVNVSQNYVIITVLKSVLKQVFEIGNSRGTTGITLEESEKMGVEEIKQRLYDHLRKHRYFIVFDDVWDESFWTMINTVFPDVYNGSRLLLTTRNLAVARIADPIPLELHLLTDEESWDLFCKKAHPTTELEYLGRQLAKSCGGLPLALVMLGRVLLTKDHTVDAWRDVAESLDWESTTHGTRYFDILALSYDELPNQYIKSCFLYIASFPVDFVISTSKLINLWVAEGFVPQTRTQGLEETARKFLDELVTRSMVHVIEQSLPYGRAKSIRLHDLVHNMCVSKARGVRLLDICSEHRYVSTSAMSIPRVALHGNSVQLGLSLSNLHTLLGFKPLLPMEISLGGLKLLRVLDLEGVKWLIRLPGEINKMIHLTYLGLRNTGLTGSLPSSIGSLFNLQTLDVRDTQVMVPSTIWMNKSLRHLHTSTWVVLPPKIRNLKNLRTLKWVKVSGSMLESNPTGLSTATNLETLALGRCLSEMRTLPNSSYFPQQLTKLVLQHFFLQEDPMPMLEKLPNLMVLKLNSYSYEGKRMFCSAGGFCQLKKLVLDSLLALEEWRVDVGAMPNLNHLTIGWCDKLKILPEGLQHLTNLKVLYLISMPKELEDSIRRMEEQWKRVRHNPKITIFPKK